jgi:hypothetical protein
LPAAAAAAGDSHRTQGNPSLHSVELPAWIDRGYKGGELRVRQNARLRSVNATRLREMMEVEFTVSHVLCCDVM